LLVLQPVGQFQEVTGHGPEPADLVLLLTPGSGDQQTSGDGLLVNVQATAVRIHNMHLSLLLAARRWTPKSVRFSLACSPLIAEATIRCAWGHPGYTGARAACAPEPYNLSAPRSRLRVKHST